MFFHGASMLTKIPKIHVYSLKTLDARASGYHFPTSPWAWSWPWGWFPKAAIIFFIMPVFRIKYPKFMSRSQSVISSSPPTASQRAARLSFVFQLPQNLKYKTLTMTAFYLRTLKSILQYILNGLLTFRQVKFFWTDPMKKMFLSCKRTAC